MPGIGGPHDHELFDIEFIDVHPHDWFADSVVWSIHHEVFHGFGEGIFGPDVIITREQLITVLCNFAVYSSFDVAPTGELDSFADACDISYWAEYAMQWAVGNGIIGGNDVGLLDPQGTATRAEIAAIITRYLRWCH